MRFLAGVAVGSLGLLALGSWLIYRGAMRTG